MKWFAAGLLVFLAVCFLKVVLGGETFFYRDFGVLGYPFIQFHHDQFWQGNPIPLWNPYSNCGQPFMAQWGTMTLYPGSLIYLLLPLPWSLNVFCLLHLWFGGLGIYLLGRRWIGSPLGASVAGFTFVVSGFVLSALMWPNYTVAIGWMPWVVLATERAWRMGGRTILWAVLAGAMQMLSGVPEFIALTWLLLAALFLQDWKRGEVPWRRGVLRFGSVVILVAALTAIQLLPFFELLGLSQREAGFAAEKWAVPWWGIGNFFAPLAHFAKTHAGAYFQWGQELFSTSYPGLAVLLLAGLAVRRKMQGRALLLAITAVLGAWLSLGEGGWLYAFIKTVVPPLGFMRYPVKFLLLTAFALPLLAGFGAVRLVMDAESDAAAMRRRLLIAAGVIAGWVVIWVVQARLWPLPTEQPADTLRNAMIRIVLLGFAVGLWLLRDRFPKSRERFLLQLGCLLVMGVDVMTHLPKWNPTVPAWHLAPGLAREQHPDLELPAPGDGRVFITPGADKAFLRSTVPDLSQDFLGKRLGLWSNLNLLDRVPKVNGSSTLRIRYQAELEKRIYDSPTNSFPRLLDFLGATHTTSPTNATAWIARDSAMPLVSVCRAARPANGDEALRGILSDDFDPVSEVWIEAEGEALDSEDPEPNQMEVKVKEFGANRLVADVAAGGEGFVVVAQTWAPGWRASVQGVPAPILRANHAFMAVRVSGEAEVIFEYRDRNFGRGAWISLAALVVLGVLGVLGRRHGKIPSREGQHH